MRTTFINTLIEFAREDETIFLLSGDLGFGVLEPFRDQFPQRFLNVGVAEQSMIGAAAGLALAGKKPVAYSIATFASLRPFEFIRNDVVYQKLNVKIVGVGAGFSYPQYAVTHQALDDIGAMRALPGIVILNPGDPIEAKLATALALKHQGPVYLRIGKKGEPVVHKTEPKFSIGEGILINEGRDVAVIATGNILENTARAVELLGQNGISARFLSFPTIEPLDIRSVERAAKEIGVIVTVEEGFDRGGLGTAVSEAVTAAGLNARLLRIGVPHRYPPEIGSQSYLRKIYGLTPDGIAASIHSFISKK